MSSGTDDVLAAALKLPAAARAALAAELIDSLERAEPAEEVERAWAEAIRERLAEADSGAVRPVPWSEARRRILAAAGIGGGGA